jgi:hypothetical protein
MACYDVKSPQTLLRYEGRMLDYWITKVVEQ